VAIHQGGLSKSEGTRSEARGIAHGYPFSHTDNAPLSRVPTSFACEQPEVYASPPFRIRRARPLCGRGCASVVAWVAAVHPRCAGRVRTDRLGAHPPALRGSSRGAAAGLHARCAGVAVRASSALRGSRAGRGSEDRRASSRAARVGAACSRAAAQPRKLSASGGGAALEWACPGAL